MGFEGRFWLLWEEEPIDMDRGRVVELRDGEALDGRTGERRGAYTETSQGVEIVFDEEYGERQVAKLHMVQEVEKIGDKFIAAARPLDPHAGGYSVTWTTVRFEAYVAARPVIENEDEEVRDEREHAEGVLFGIVPTYGFALRDGPHIQEMHDENQRQAKELTVLH
jgi:hypothetical protein